MQIKKIDLEIRDGSRMVFMFRIRYVRRFDKRRISIATKIEFSKRTQSHQEVIKLVRNKVLERKYFRKLEFENFESLFDFLSSLFNIKYSNRYALKVLFYRLSKFIGFLFTHNFIDSEGVSKLLSYVNKIAESNKYTRAAAVYYSGFNENVLSPYSFFVRVRNYLSIAIDYWLYAILNLKTLHLSIFPREYSTDFMQKIENYVCVKNPRRTFFVQVFKEEVREAFELIGLLR